MLMLMLMLVLALVLVLMADRLVVLVFLCPPNEWAVGRRKAGSMGSDVEDEDAESG